MASSVNKVGQRSEMSEAEWLTRVELAALYRLTALFGWDQVIYNHISARVPGEPDAFLVNPFGMTFDEIRASDLAKVHADGTTVDGMGFGVNAAGFFLHSVIHEARPDLNCVMHFHSIEVAAVANHPQGLLPICQEAMANFAKSRRNTAPMAGQVIRWIWITRTMKESVRTTISRELSGSRKSSSNSARRTRFCF